MEIIGEQLIPLPQQRVWEALNDPEILKACIPGCQSIEKVSDSDYKIVMTAAVGPVKAKFNGKLHLADLNSPDSYSLSFEGSGGAAGFGKGSAKVMLSPEDKGTKLSYSAQAQVGGKLAQIGSRLIDGVAHKMAEDFFKRFNNTVAPAAPAETAAEAAPQKPEKTSLLSLWIVAALILIAIIVYAIWATHG